METKEKNLEQDIESWLLSEGDYVREITELPELQGNEVFRFSMAG
jgi:hypothetical protein